MTKCNVSQHNGFSIKLIQRPNSMFLNAKPPQGSPRTTCTVSHCKGLLIKLIQLRNSMCFNTTASHWNSTTKCTVSQCNGFSIKNQMTKFNVCQCIGFWMKFNDNMRCYSMQRLLNEVHLNEVHWRNMLCFSMRQLLNQIQWQHALFLAVTASGFSLKFNDAVHCFSMQVLLNEIKWQKLTKMLCFSLKEHLNKSQAPNPMFPDPTPS